jgi:hypothetical protein
MLLAAESFFLKAWNGIQLHDRTRDESVDLGDQKYPNLTLFLFYAEKRWQQEEESQGQ